MAQTFRMTQDHRDLLDKAGDGHKYTHGHAVVVSGPARQGGAARLAATAALRIGAGVVSVICDEDARAEHASRLDAVMVKVASDDHFSQTLRTIAPAAICIGPNLGTDTQAADRLWAVLVGNAAICLDADALTLIGQSPDRLIAAQPRCAVMTPHAGELRRLIPDVCEQTEDRIAQARAAAARYGCTVLSKGRPTIVAQSDGTVQIVVADHYEHAAWLATAGSGDVLAGMITGLLARGYTASDAACVAADMHLRCAQAFGPGLISEDLPRLIPQVLADILG
ncbi:NAD(P)H-hydrate dehydratase [Yoonia sp. 208BN28-4]|uniref:NAD(P)H-hydrate dehydratase n=1 Tax=Yoonia sp. 208BN28-4 TaxID=3126505 RepID=UPI0030A32BB2